MTLLDIDGIAAILKIPRTRVRDVVVKRPDFPKPAVTISQKTRRWLLEDIQRWIATH